MTEFIKPRGKMVLIDVPEQPLVIPPVALIYNHISITGTYVGSNDDLREMLDFASKTGVRPWITTVDNSIEGVNQGVKDLLNGRGHYRIVIDGVGRGKALNEK
jgi:D-arabinose 1-dehydrogenase-like Zn-dependent alcohol dehydrogenase